MNDETLPVRAGQLRPEMASLRLKVLAFVRAYIRAHGGSPSYGEIAAGLGTNRERVRKAVKRLIAAGELGRAPGPRGLVLPSDEREALLRLGALGWSIDEARMRLGLPGVTKRPLRGNVELDYVPERPEGDGGEGDDGEAATD